MKKRFQLLSIILIIVMLFSMAGCGNTGETYEDTTDAGNTVGTSGEENDITVGIAWTDEPGAYSIVCMNTAVKETGVNYVTLDMVKSYDLKYNSKDKLLYAKYPTGILSSKSAKLVKENTWMNSNVEEVMEGIDCIIFPGGKDISPTLYYEEQEWHGIREETSYCAERDVSDYLLMKYCLEHDIPILAICRGMQMLSVVSGAEMIQDLNAWYSWWGIEYNNEHRDPEKQVLVPHPVQVSEDSLLYDIVGTTTLEGCPSWHHQAVLSVENTRLTVTGQTDTQGTQIIEAVERRYRTFCLGLQFHPEVAVGSILDNLATAESFMDYDTAMSFFYALIDAAREKKSQELDLAA